MPFNESQITRYTGWTKSEYFGRKNQDGGRVWVFLEICQERNLRSDEEEHRNDNRRVNLIDNAFTRRGAGRYHDVFSVSDGIDGSHLVRK